MSDNHVRKSQTMSEEAKNAMHITNPASQQPFMMMPGGSTLTSGGQPIGSLPRAAPGASQQRMLEMMDEK